MSGIDNGADGRGKPDLKLSRRSMVAAGALLATLGGGVFAKKARAAGPPNEGPVHGASYGLYCKTASPSDPACLCFLSSTRLKTPSGEAAIETLSIGDLVTNKNGEARAIRWVGRITVDGDGDAPWRSDAMPIRVSKDAFGNGTPHRDLYLSRSHMVHLNGVLIPVGDLINGRTIAAVDLPGDQLVYYHIELETHDVVIAEGAPCETLLTSEEKIAAFDNADEYHALYGVPADMAAYAPLAAFVGGRSELKSRLRSAIAVVVDMRDRRDVARDSIESRAFDKAA